MNRTGVSAYANVQARVKAMLSQMLDRSMWTRLSASNDQEMLISLLRSTAYGKYLAGVKDSVLTTRRTAFEIRKRLAEVFITVINHSPNFAKPLIEQLFKIYEVDNLKAVLRGITAGEGWEQTRYMLFSMEGYPTLPYQNLMEAGNIQKALDLLSKTTYRKELEPALSRYEKENSLFPLEVSLDLNYWQDTWKLIGDLPPSDSAVARELIGMIVDKNNLMWAARYRDFHKMNESEIIDYTLSFGNKVNDKVIKEIAGGKDPFTSVKEIYPKVSITVDHVPGSTPELAILESILERQIKAKCISATTGNPFNIGLLIGFLFQLENEVHDLVVMLEAKSMGIKPTFYQNYLINQIENA